MKAARITNIQNPTKAQIDFVMENNRFSIPDNVNILNQKGVLSFPQIGDTQLIFRLINGELYIFSTDKNITEAQINTAIQNENIGNPEDYLFGSIANLTYFIVKSDGKIIMKNSNGSISIAQNGDIEIKSNKIGINANGQELLSIIKNMATAIQSITIGGFPIDNPTPFIQIATQINGMQI
jgi:hypothetical protein